MDLWIRSQDKERLGKIVYLELKNDDYGFYLIGWRDKFEGTRMATYKTKERALEVLDEIQDVLMPKIKVLQSVNAENNIDDLVSRPTIQECCKVELLQYSDYVYEMPLE